jgi:hypothetical protein
VTLIQRFVLDGAYVTGTHPPVFRRIPAPSARALQALLERIAERIGRARERKGLLVRDCETSFFTFDPTAGGAMDDLLAARRHRHRGTGAREAGTARPLCEPARVSVERLALTAQGDVRYRLKTPYRDGTTHILLEPLDFLGRLASLVPPPRVHSTRYHGVLAPHAASSRRTARRRRPRADPSACR